MIIIIKHMLVIITSCLLISLLFAPLGCLLLWQRQSYFSDGLAHSGLLAASISTALSLSPLITAPIIAAIFALLIFITRPSLGSGNGTINLVSSTMLALGILVASLFPGKINLSGLLIGDILSVTYGSTIALGSLCLCVAILLWWKLDSIILLSLNSDLAQSRGINGRRMEFFFLIFLSLVLAVGMKIIGALLSSALLIIPAATSYLLSRTPLQMIVFSIIISIASSTLGLIASFQLDLPTASCIILSCSLIHFVILLANKLLIPEL